jgi:hypothetical protein
MHDQCNGVQSTSDSPFSKILPRLPRSLFPFMNVRTETRSHTRETGENPMWKMNSTLERKKNHCLQQPSPLLPSYFLGHTLDPSITQHTNFSTCGAQPLTPCLSNVSSGTRARPAHDVLLPRHTIYSSATRDPTASPARPGHWHSLKLNET